MLSGMRGAGAVTLCYKLLHIGNLRVTAGAHHAAIRERSDHPTTKENIMKTTTILLNSLLALALAGIGNAYAAEEAQVQTREEIRAQHLKDTAGMTVEQREQYRLEQQAQMTDEQRAALRAEKQKQKAEQKKNKSATKQGAGNGTMLRDGSGAGSQRGSQGGMGMGR
jgi:acyl-CoA synthetase (AMP-forming)/AMP-acid ligase II